jgi:ABC-type antimicrobial peptide transport system permease subunit
MRLEGRPVTVVGVARDGRYDYRSIDEPPAPLVYYALAQAPSRFVTLHVRTDADPASTIPLVRNAIAGVDPQVTTLTPLTLEAYTAAPLMPTDMALRFLGLLGVVALILSVMGLQTIVAYGVAIRTREIGIRLALGASAGRVIGIFLRQTVTLMALGLAGGILSTAATLMVLQRQLAYLSAIDSGAMLWPGALLTVSAVGAGYWAARRATRIDPSRVLRAD